MKLLRPSQIKWNYLAIAFLLPFLGMTGVMVMSEYVPFGEYSVLYSDMYHQYYPFFLEFREALLSGEGLQWNWSVGLGMDYLGLIAYYLASPLNLITVLVPKSMMLTCFSMLLPVKLGFAGLFFALFLKKIFNKNDWSIVLFGVFYATCAWALGYQWNIMWMDTFALLPLIMLGMVSLLEKRKFLLYTFTLFLAVFANYYIGLFICIFVFLSFFAYEICRFKSIKKCIVDLLLMGVFSGLALGMTLILELPAYVALQNTQSTVNNFPKDFRLNMVTEHNLKGLLQAMQMVAGNLNGGITHTFKEGLPNVYTGAGTMLLSFLFITCPEIKIRDKICSIIMLLILMVSFIIRQLDYIWHGFHFTNMIPYRFSFLVSFVLLYMGYRAFLLRHKFKLWQVVVATALSLGIVFCYEDYKDTVYLTFNLVLLCLYVSAYLYRTLPVSRKKYSKKEQLVIHDERRRLCNMTIAGVMIIEFVLNMVNYGMHFTGTSIVSYPRGTTNSAQAIALMKEREKDTLFYRSEFTHAQTLNDGALNDIDGISAFTSSAYVNVTKFMQALGYGAKNTYNRYAYEQSSPVADLFLNLKYLIDREGNGSGSAYYDPVESFGNVTLLENNAYLPLGFLANSELGDFVFTTASDRFAFQNELLEAAAGVKDVWSTLYGSALQVTASDKITLSSVSANGICSYTASGSGTVTFSYYPETEGFFCVDLNLSKKNSYTVKKNGQKLYSETYSLPQMIAVGDVAPGDRIDIVFSCTANTSGTLNVDNGLLSEEKFRQAHQTLAASTLELTEFSTTKVSGTIDCNRSGLLYTSIPQTGCWVATVDGLAAETVMIGDAMLGIYLPEGSHTVTLTYRNDAFLAGSAASFFCLAVLIALWVIFYKPYEKFKKA